MSLRSAFSFPPPLCPLSNLALLLRYVVDVLWDVSHRSFRCPHSISKVHFAHQCRSSTSSRLAFQNLRTMRPQQLESNISIWETLFLKNGATGTKRAKSVAPAVFARVCPLSAADFILSAHNDGERAFMYEL